MIREEEMTRKVDRSNDFDPRSPARHDFENNYYENSTLES